MESIDIFESHDHPSAAQSCRPSGPSLLQMTSPPTDIDITASIPKLKGAENYQIWAPYAQAVLKEASCYDTVNNPPYKPGQADNTQNLDHKNHEPESTEWHHKNAIAINLLARMCTPIIIAELIYHPTARSIWVYLKKRYDRVSFADAVSKWEALTTFRVVQAMSLAAVCQAYKLVVDEARLAGHVVDDGMAISNFLVGVEGVGGVRSACSQSWMLQGVGEGQWPPLDAFLTTFAYGSGIDDCCDFALCKCE